MLYRLATALVLVSSAVQAEAPRVVTDIAPVHSLVAMVTEGMAQPDLLMAPGASAHHFSLKPSQARALSDADLVVWIGPALTPGLADSIDTLAPQAAQLILTQAEGSHLLPYRDAGAFAQAQDHGHEDGHDDAHEEDHEGEHEEDGHDDHADHMDEDHDEPHAHDADAPDPHLWLDPENAQLWLDLIAQALAAQDPENAALYAGNATKGRAAIQAATEQATQGLAGQSETKLAVFHDAFQYYEAAFGLKVIGALSDSEAAPAGPALLDALRDHLTHEQPRCVLTEPGSNLKLLRAVAPDLPIAELDPMGRDLPQGAPLYPALITGLAQSIAGCGA